MTSDQTYKIFQVLCAVATIGWAAAYGYENYRGGECTETFKTVAESNQTRIKSVQDRIERVRVREQNLQARTGELIKRFSPADGSAGTK